MSLVDGSSYTVADGSPTYTMITTGDAAAADEALSDTDMLAKVDTIFRSLFPDNTLSAQATLLTTELYNNAPITGYNVSRWLSDQDSMGSHSYLTPGALPSDRTTLCTSDGNGIFWAGEHGDLKHPSTGERMIGKN